MDIDNFAQISDPADREIIAIVGMAFLALTREDKYLGIAIFGHRQHMDWAMQKLRNSVVWESPKKVKLFREGIEIVNGGKVIFMTMHNPERLRGMTPTEVKLFGDIGELFYLLSVFDNVVGVA